MYTPATGYQPPPVQYQAFNHFTADRGASTPQQPPPSRLYGKGHPRDDPDAPPFRSLHTRDSKNGSGGRGEFGGTSSVSHFGKRPYDEALHSDDQRKKAKNVLTPTGAGFTPTSQMQLAQGVARLEALSTAIKDMRNLCAQPANNQHGLAIEFVDRSITNLLPHEAFQLLANVVTFKGVDPGAHGLLCWHLSKHADLNSRIPLRPLVRLVAREPGVDVARIAYAISEHRRDIARLDELIDQWVCAVDAESKFAASQVLFAHHAMAMGAKASHSSVFPAPVPLSPMAGSDVGGSTLTPALQAALTDGACGIAMAFGAVGLAKEDESAFKRKLLGDNRQSRYEVVNNWILQGVDRAIGAHCETDAQKYAPNSTFRKAVRLPGAVPSHLMAAELVKAAQIKPGLLLRKVLLEFMKHAAPEMSHETFAAVRQVLLERIKPLAAPYQDGGEDCVTLMTDAYRTYLQHSAVGCAFMAHDSGPAMQQKFNSMAFQLDGFAEFVENESQALSKAGPLLQPVLDMLGRRSESLVKAIALSAEFDAAPGGDAGDTDLQSIEDAEAAEAYQAARREQAQLERRLGLAQRLEIPEPPISVPRTGRGRRRARPPVSPAPLPDAQDS